MKYEEVSNPRQSSITVIRNNDDTFEFYLSSYFTKTKERGKNILVNKEQLRDLMMSVIMTAKKVIPDKIFKDVYGRDLMECYLCGKVLKEEVKYRNGGRKESGMATTQ